MPGHGKKPIKASELEEIAAELRLRAGKIAKLATVMEKKKLPHAEVMGEPMVQRSLKSIDRFISSCKIEMGEV